MLPIYADRLGSPAEEIVKNQVLDLVAVSLANATNGKRPRLSSARSFALMKVRAAIETRLTDPALDASTVASAAGVSVRYANAACRLWHVDTTSHSGEAPRTLPKGA
jgi:hypothetical protein